MKSLVIYHAHCLDGFTAAWAAWKKLGDTADYVAAKYDDPPPDVTGREVFIVDFSYKRDVLEEMARTAKSIVVLDHHKTTKEDLASLPLAGDNHAHHAKVYEGHLALHSGPPLFALFDMERSGAMIAWEWFNPDDSVPWLIRYVQDRDLWQFQYDETKNINAALFSYDFDFALWSELQSYCGELGELGEEGEVLLRAHDKAVREMCCHEFRTVRFFSSLNAEEIHVPFINCPASLASDVGNVLALKHPVVALYFDTATHRAVSLRSSKENPSHLDVSAIAAGFGGGGHKHAAGFRVPLNWEGE